MADAIIGNTQLGATKQDIIAAIVQKELKFQAKLLPSILDVSAFAVKGSKSISFPKFTSFTAVDRASGVAGDATALTSTVDQLSLDVNAYVAWLVDAMDEVQSTVQVQALLAQRAASALGRFVDEKIIAELESVGTATTTAGDITRDIVLDMREALLSKFADPGLMSLAISVDQEKEMLKIAEFTRADIYGSSNVPSGMIGRVYGVPVMIHNGLGAQTFYMYEKSGLCIGFQSGPNMSQQPANEYGANSMRVAMDQLYGVKGLQIAQAGAAAGKSALVVKDNN